MLPLANRPMMEHILNLVRRHAFEEVVVTLAFMPDVIRNYFGDGSEFGVDIAYATEETPLGTAGSVRNAAEQLGERFVVVSGDVLTDIDLDKVIAAHEEKGALATIALARVDTRSSASSRSPAGARCSATRSTPACSSSSPRSSTTSTPTARWTSRTRSSRPCWSRASRSTAR
jgi:NDP-sugar pyrophosphorylase family protein